MPWFAGADGVHGGWESMEPGAMVLGAMAEEDALALLSTLVVLALRDPIIVQTFLNC